MTAPLFSMEIVVTCLPGVHYDNFDKSYLLEACIDVNEKFTRLQSRNDFA